MSEPGETEGEPLTVEEVIAAVHKTGFTIVWDDKRGDATLMRPNTPAHISGDMMTQLKRVKLDLIIKWDECPACKCGYMFLHRKDVGRLCDKVTCPVRSLK